MTPGQSPDSDNVTKHYEQLAPLYDRKANRACNAAYLDLVSRTIGESQRVLELGAGSGDLLAQLDCDFGIASDLSLPMLSSGTRGKSRPINSDSHHLPFAPDSFEAVYCINMLEHVRSPEEVVREACRVLEPGGIFLAVTPNGDLERLLDLLEWAHLKLPEGPHKFLKSNDLKEIGDSSLNLIDFKTFLILPLGPRFFVNLIDSIAYGLRIPGLFQFIIARKQLP